MKTLSLLFVLVSPSVRAEGPASSGQEFEVPEISVTGAGPEFDAPVTPAVRLSGRKLERKKQSTLGETLSREVGVSSTFFGPNSSRPVIRGLDGDRVRLLENGIGLLDASGASPDHAVAIDPWVIESVDVLRGASALLFGSTAPGGVVNFKTRRIAEKLESGFTGRVQSGYSSVDRGKVLGGSVDGAVGGTQKNTMVHMDGSIRSSEDYAAPGVESGKVVNSANRASQGAVGVSRILDQGHVGLSLSGYQSEYGTVASPDVTIHMDRVRAELSSELRGFAGLDSLRLRSAYSKYEHREIHEGEVGTIFRNRGVESRLDAKSGNTMFGLQQNTFTLRALGEEAFLPTTTNTTFAGFGFHQWNLSRFTPSIGVRLERAGVDSEAGGAFTTAESRSFWAPSTSMGLSYALNRPEPGMPAWTLESSAGYTERAPNYQELFANGAHEATGIFEIGNSNFQTEKSVSLELAVRAKSIRDELRIGGYHQQYSNFIALLPTGGQQDGLDVYQFGAVRARIFGVEAEYRHQMAGRWLDGNWDFEFKADAMRGLNLSTHDSLPRMIPVRGTFGVNYKQQNFSADLELQRNEGQSLLAANESATRGFTFLNAGAEVPVSTGFGVFRASLRANNLFNVDGRNHVSFLKDLAPLPGRNFVLALEAAI